MDDRSAAPGVDVGERGEDRGDLTMRTYSYGRQSISEEDVIRVNETLRGDFITAGPGVRAFEQAICDYTGAKYCVAVANGTAALHIAALATGLGPGD